MVQDDSSTASDASGTPMRRTSKRAGVRTPGPRPWYVSYATPMLGILVTAMAIAACQELDPNLATGSGPVDNGASPVETADVGVPPPPKPDVGMPRPATDSSAPETAQLACDKTRAEARGILETQCAYCHQAPQNQRSVYATGQFNFILELDKITTLRSTVFTGKNYVAANNPAGSLIYERTSNNTMPPMNINQRPSMADLAVLNRWISNCVDGSSTGWPPPPKVAADDGGAGTDADVPEGCGAAGQACCAANVCNAGGCCVGGLCRGNGSTCAAPPPEPGAAPMASLPGTCMNGSCATADGGACGKPSEPCCDGTCTASQSSCLLGTTTCSVCGDTGQACCRPNSCLAGRVCINGGVGRTGNCQVCGATGQPCCGSGSAAQQTCDDGLTCTVVPSMGNFCGGGATDGGAGDR